MVRMKFTGPEVRHGLTIDLRESIEDVHLNAYAELGIFYVGENLVIELSDSDEEGHKGEEQDITCMREMMKKSGMRNYQFHLYSW